MKFCEILQELLVQRRITAQQLAQTIHIPETDIERYLSGDEEPDFATLVLLAKSFGVTTDDLLEHLMDNDRIKEETALNLYRSLSDKQKALLMECGHRLLNT